MTEETWIDKLSKKVIDANKVDAFSSVQDVLEYAHEIINSLFNIDELAGENFEYSNRDNKFIRLRIFNKQLVIVASESDEIVTIKTGEVSNMELSVVGAVTLSDNFYNDALGTLREKFTRFQLEKIIQEFFEFR